jgi:serine/threonine protein kinase
MSPESTRPRHDTPNALPAGTRLGEFELRGLLGVGGFGIVYLAFDHALEREVAIKEYMPASLAGRTETMQVSLRSQSDAETFALGLKSFVNEARLLARFDHPSLLKVHRFWEANGTAYMAMPVMRGRTVREVRLAMTASPGEAWLRALLEPLLEAIEKLHSEGVYHRDIAPDNIQIEPDGHPVLLDFGAARRVISDKSQTLTAILKPAYAPIEQYAEAGSVKQGPWTDIYALGATLHFLLLARPPAPATARAIHDEASALTTQALPGCSEAFLRTVDWMLAPRPNDRPQSVAAVRAALDASTQPALRRAVQDDDAQWERTVVLPTGAGPARGAVPVDVDGAPHAGSASAREEPLRQATPLAAPGPATPARPAPKPALPVSPPELNFAAPPVAGALSAPPRPAGRSTWLRLGVGLGTVAVAVTAFALWPRLPASDSLAGAAASAAATGASQTPISAISAVLPASLPEPVAASMPESAVATVVVRPHAPEPRPLASPADTALAPAASGRGALRHPAEDAGRSAAGSSAQRPAVATVAAPLTQAAARPAEGLSAAQRVVQEPPAPRAPASEVAVTALAAAPAAASEASKVVTAGPVARCAGRNPIRHFLCMERECLRAQLQTHPDCLNWRKEAKRGE